MVFVAYDFCEICFLASSRRGLKENAKNAAEKSKDNLLISNLFVDELKESSPQNGNDQDRASSKPQKLKSYKVDFEDDFDSKNKAKSIMNMKRIVVRCMIARTDRLGWGKTGQNRSGRLRLH